jgi:hypothetical protein
MTKKCIYCKTPLDESSVMDVCKRCGIQVWGEKMFNAIVQNMEGARSSGNLYQGSVTSEDSKPAKKPVSPPGVMKIQEKIVPQFNSVQEPKESYDTIEIIDPYSYE